MGDSWEMKIGGGWFEEGSCRESCLGSCGYTRIQEKDEVGMLCKRTAAIVAFKQAHTSGLSSPFGPEGKAIPYLKLPHPFLLFSTPPSF